MNIRRASLGFAMAGLFAASVSVAAPSDSSPGVDTSGAPNAADPRIQRALNRYVAQHLAQSGLEGSLRGYSLSPALVQLRRYADPGQKQTKFVCVVSLSLQNQQREIIAEVRGTAAPSARRSSRRSPPPLTPRCCASGRLATYERAPGRAASPSAKSRKGRARHAVCTITSRRLARPDDA